VAEAIKDQAGVCGVYDSLDSMSSDVEYAFLTDKGSLQDPPEVV